MKSMIDGWKEFDKTIDYDPERLQLLRSSFSFELNANDLFGWGTSDSVQVSVFDMWWILPIIKEYGYTGQTAVMWYIEKVMPIKPHRTFKLIEAYRKIKELDPDVQSERCVDD